MKRIGITGKRRSRAAAAVEFAILLPVLLTIVLGCADFGRFAYAYVGVTNACGEAATFAGMHAPTEFPGGMEEWIEAIGQQAVNEAPTLLPGIDPADVQVDVEVLDQGYVLVRVEYAFETVVPWPGIPADTTIRRTAVMPQMP